MLGNFHDFFCLLTFFKTNFFKKFFQEHNHSVKQFDADQARHYVRPDLDQTVCKDYQLMRKVAAGTQRVNSLLVSPADNLCIQFGNRSSPIKCKRT